MRDLSIESDKFKPYGQGVCFYHIRQFRELTGKISRFEVTLGKTIDDDSLYLDLRWVLTNIDTLVTDFKAHPEKYVHLSIF